MKPRVLWMAAASCLVAAFEARAHAMLERAAPAVGSVVHASPARVEMWFSEDLEPVFTTARVLDGAGRQVDKADKSLDKADRRHLLLSLPTLPPGRYRVVWHALSADSHVTDGDFTFQLAP